MAIQHDWSVARLCRKRTAEAGNNGRAFVNEARKDLDHAGASVEHAKRVVGCVYSAYTDHWQTAFHLRRQVANDFAGTWAKRPPTQAASLMCGHMQPVTTDGRIDRYDSPHSGDQAGGDDIVDRRPREIGRNFDE